MYENAIQMQLQTKVDQQYNKINLPSIVKIQHDSVVPIIRNYISVQSMLRIIKRKCSSASFSG